MVCASVKRIFTLSISVAPYTKRATRLSQNISENPNTKTDIEQSAKAANSFLPQWRKGPRLDNTIPAATAPIAGIPRIRPSPFGPTSRMSAAYIGSSASTLLRRTINRSNRIIPSNILFLATNLMPLRNGFRPVSTGAFIVNFGRNRYAVNETTTINRHIP